MIETIPDEPLGSHVLELRIAEVVTEADDGQSLVFTVPEEEDSQVISPSRLRYTSASL
ncbi:hypothetical protein ABFA25_05735 [Mycobacterium lepromatosis]|uniref:hypothetical protein n=1 Tax=Mycobacterium lepromatosis TaxID=480418 RepID=UPI000AC9AD83|nr:hypothetical protein [Mycobacterium lepromatosis]